MRNADSMKVVLLRVTRFNRAAGARLRAVFKQPLIRNPQSAIRNRLDFGGVAGRNLA
jgi:hypothetical protein